MNFKISKISIQRKLVQKRDKQILYGIVRQKNCFGQTKYSLAPSKQVPIQDTFELIEKEKSQNITNLTNELQRVYYNGIEFTTLFEEQPHLNRTVGSLPQKWGRKVGKSKEKREEIDKLFTDFAKEFHKNASDYSTTVEIDTKPLETGLSKILETEVKIEKYEKGFWGQTYKINADNQNYILKTYYKRKPQLYKTEAHDHGNFFELSSAIWANKNAPGQYATCYMGRFGEDMDGYILTKFLPPVSHCGREINNLLDIHPKNFAFARYFDKLKCFDMEYYSSRNIIGKKIIDFGNTRPTTASKLNNKTYVLAKTMGRFIDENNIEGLKKLKLKHIDTKEYQESVSFLRYLINNNTRLGNYQIIKSKKDLLKVIGLDGSPDIRHILKKGRKRFDRKDYVTFYNYDKMFEIPPEEFLKLWDKYQQKLDLK